jgi:hypothetical protein
MPFMNTRRQFLSAVVALVAVPRAAFAATINRFSLSKTGHALRGYDTTAYFKTGTPTDGTDSTTVDWKGAKWRFATTKDAALFLANPNDFAPQFGGYCTRAMSLQKEVPADPEVWRIHNGKLYVFYARKGGEIFDKGRDDMIALAQTHWDTLTLTE